MARSTRSLPDCKGTWACLAIRGELAISANQFIAPVHRLNRGNAQLLQISSIQNRMYHVFESQGPIEIAPPPAQIDSRDHHLAIARADQCIHFVKNLV